MNNEKKFDYSVLAVFFPAVAALAIIPILMRATFVTTDFIETFRLFSATEGDDGLYYLIDTFSQCKAFAVVVFAIIMLVVAFLSCIYLFRRIEKRSLVYVCASGVFVAMALISALLSDYRNIAFYGEYDRAEGFFTTACYFVIFLFTMFAFKHEQNFRPVMIALFICVGVNVVLGAFEYAGYALEKQDWFAPFIIDGRYSDQIQISSSVAAKGSLFGTLYHYNYVGSFTGMVIPLFTCLALFEKQTKWRVLYIIFDLGAFFLLFGSTARSGIVALVAVIIVGIIMFARVIAKHWKAAAAVTVGCAAVLVGVNFALGGALFSRIPSIASEALDLILPAESGVSLYDALPVREIIHNDNGTLSFVTNSDTLTIAFDEAELDYNFTDSSGNDVPMSYNDDGTVTVDDDRFRGFTMAFGDYNENTDYDDLFVLWFDGNQNSVLAFRVFSEKSIHEIDINVGDKITTENAESIGFEGKELVGSSRGYIWSRTLPLLKNCLITGYGADTFPYVFPQNDHLAKWYSYWQNFNMTVDKPHNLYLQIFFSHGLIALVAFLLICVWYLVDCIRLYALKREYRQNQIYGAAIMLAVVGYLAAGLFNDSIVSVAPVFWILLGTGCALNTINRRADKGESLDDDIKKVRTLSKKEKQLESEAEAMSQKVIQKLHEKDTEKSNRQISAQEMQTLMNRVKNITNADSKKDENSSDN